MYLLLINAFEILAEAVQLRDVGRQLDLADRPGRLVTQQNCVHQPWGLVETCQRFHVNRGGLTEAVPQTLEMAGLILH
jgi:hypothetical protein